MISLDGDILEFGADSWQTPPATSWPGTQTPRGPARQPQLCLGQGVPGGRRGGAGRGAPVKFGPQPRGAAVSRELAGGAQVWAAALPGRRRQRSAQARRAGFPRLRLGPPPAGPPPCAMAGCAARAPPGSEARLSLATFLLGASVLALPLLTRAGLQGRTGLALYVAGLNALLLLLYRPPRYQVRAGPRAGAGTGGRAGWARRVGTVPPGSRSGSAESAARETGCLPRPRLLAAASSGGRRAPLPASPGGRGSRSPSTRRSGWEVAVGAVQQLRQMHVGWGVSGPTSSFM